MKSITPGLKYTLVFTILLVCVFSLVGLSYADPNGQRGFVAPEPGTMALISTGFIGWVVSVARRRFQQFKRVLDIISSLVGIVVAAPLVAFTGLIVKIVSPGPVFFKQERVGHNGRIFEIYKIRTMQIDAEKYTGPIWAREDDSRLIKFNLVIQHYHI